MKKFSLILALALTPTMGFSQQVLIGGPDPDGALGQEQEESAQEGEEHSGESAEPEEEREPPTIEAVALFLEGKVAVWTTEQGGWMKVADDVTGGDLELRLDKIHRERLSKTSKGTYFVCADFTTPEGKTWDLDFWVKDTADGLEVDETTIHKEEGVARYMWYEEDGVWVRK